MVLLKLESIDNPEDAEKLKNSYLEIDREDAVPLEEGTYFIADLIGLEVYTDDGKLLGKVEDIYNTGSKDIYVVKDELGKQVLLPGIDEVIKEVKLDDRNFINIRDFSKNKHKKVDDTPYGGGAGMVMQADVVYDAYKSINDSNAKVIYMSPQGNVLNQKKVERLSKEEHLIILCGHYEGIDQRVIDKIVDEEISIGDYVLTGGEIPAMVLIDSVSRYVDGVLSQDSTSEESFSQGILEYPQYTRPEIFDGVKVPDVLLSGHHANISKWRRCEALKNTYYKRPELLEKVKLSDEDKKIIKNLERRR